VERIQNAATAFAWRKALVVLDIVAHWRFFAAECAYRKFTVLEHAALALLETEKFVPVENTVVLVNA